MKIKGPLNGVVVLDCTRVLAGPYCCMMLYEQGARVIKVERPIVGDDSRAFGPNIKGKSGYFQSVNYGKESIALNLKDIVDRKIFEKLMAKADILVEGFRPGVMKRLGYNWEIVHKKYPKLIYASISGFGQTGPFSPKPAYDIVMQGYGGIMSLTGDKGSTKPVKVGLSFADISSGLYCFSGINAALFYREKTGKATRVDIAQFDCQLGFETNQIMNYFHSKKIPTKKGLRHGSISPFEVYNTKDGYLSICCGNDTLFIKLCKGIKREELIEKKIYSNNNLRMKNVDKLKIELEKTFKTKNTKYWIKVLENVGVPCGPINNLKKALNLKQTISRNMILELNDKISGKVKLVGNPVKISIFKNGTKRKSAPNLNEDRKKILKFIKN